MAPKVAGPLPFLFMVLVMVVSSVAFKAAPVGRRGRKREEREKAKGEEMRGTSGPRRSVDDQR